MFHSDHCRNPRAAEGAGSQSNTVPVPVLAMEAVLQRRPLIIEPGGLEGEGFESGLLKIGIEGGGSLIS